MSKLRLTCAGLDYWDRSRGLMDGSIRPTGIDLNYLIVPPGELFRRTAQFAEFEVSEFSVSTYTALYARGDRRFVAIPVFPSRNFRHGYLWINTRAGIDKPEDLKGKRIGVPEYQMTAALWIRAVLQHDYGVKPSDMHWFTGGLWSPGYEERAELDLPSDVELTVIPEHRYLEEMLDAGDIDALFSPARPGSFVAGDDKVKRLFPNFREVEKDYYKRTGYFPIMHTVVIRREVYEANRWIAMSLFEAYENTKRRARQRFISTGSLTVSLPWLADDLDEIEETFGGQDPFVYGIEPNRNILNAMIGYSVEQGLATRKVEIEELFAEECFGTLETVPHPGFSAN